MYTVLFILQKCIHKIYYVALIVQHDQRNQQRRHVWNESLKMFHDLC